MIGREPDEESDMCRAYTSQMLVFILKSFFFLFILGDLR